jgi:hypothetical protein
VLGHQRNEFPYAARCDGKLQHLAIPLIQTEDHVLARCPPTSFPRGFTAEHGLIHLDLTRESRQLLQGLLVDRLSQDLEPPLNGILMNRYLEAQTICRNAKTEEFYQATFPIRGDPGLGPSRLTELPGQTAAATALLPR